MRRSASGIAAATIATAYCLLPAASAMAADIRMDLRGDGNVQILASEPIEDDLYVFGGGVTVSADVSGDVVALGSEIVISGTVAGDVFAAGGDVTVTGAVLGSVRALAGTVTVSGAVRDDLVVAAGDLTVAAAASVGGDLLAGVRTLIVEAPVGGSFLSAGVDAIIAAPVGAWADIKAHRVALKKGAMIGGDLTLETVEPAVIDEGVTVAGARNVSVSPKRGPNALDAVLAGFWKSVTLAIAALLLIAVFRKKGETIVHEFQGRVWRNAAWGIGGLILPIPAAVLLAMTLVGIPFAIGILFLYLIALYVAAAWSAVFVGTWALRLMKKKAPVDWRAALLGVLILWVVAMVPRLGILLESALLVYALGVTLRVDARAVTLLREADLHP